MVRHAKLPPGMEPPEPRRDLAAADQLPDLLPFRKPLRGTKAITANVPRDLWLEIRDDAARCGLSRSAYMVEALRAYLRRPAA